MLQNLNWDALDGLARQQLRLYSDLGDQMQIDAEKRRAALRLDERGWADWSGFLDDGPLPAQPPLPAMLQRIGRASYRLAVQAERRGRGNRA